MFLEQATTSLGLNSAARWNNNF